MAARTRSDLLVSFFPLGRGGFFCALFSLFFRREGLGRGFINRRRTSSSFVGFGMADNLHDEITPFMVARAEAINSYSTLEQHLCACFAFFGSIEESTAGAIFFKISAARSRRTILDDLKKQKVGVKYTGYWASLLLESARLDDRRNEIIHWTVAFGVYENLETGGMRLARPMLKKPNYWAWDENTPELFQADLEKFGRRCEILSGSLAGLLMVFRGKPGLLSVTGTMDTWREICQRPLDDPLPPDHPLYQKPRAP